MKENNELMWALIGYQHRSQKEGEVLARFSTKEEAEFYVQQSRFTKERYHHIFKARSLLYGCKDYKIVPYAPMPEPPLNPRMY